MPPDRTIASNEEPITRTVAVFWSSLIELDQF